MDGREGVGVWCEDGWAVEEEAAGSSPCLNASRTNWERPLNVDGFLPMAWCRRGDGPWRMIERAELVEALESLLSLDHHSVGPSSDDPRRLLVTVRRGCVESMNLLLHPEIVKAEEPRQMVSNLKT